MPDLQNDIKKQAVDATVGTVKEGVAAIVKALGAAVGAPALEEAQESQANLSSDKAEVKERADDAALRMSLRGQMRDMDVSEQGRLINSSKKLVKDTIEKEEKLAKEAKEV